MSYPYQTCGMGTGAGPRGWDAKDTEEDLQLQMYFDSPEVSKEDVTVSVDHNFLVIKHSASGYSDRFGFDEEVYLTDKVKAEMKNGVLKVVVPKIKKEKPPVLNVNIE